MIEHLLENIITREISDLFEKFCSLTGLSVSVVTPLGECLISTSDQSSSPREQLHQHTLNPLPSKEEEDNSGKGEFRQKKFSLYRSENGFNYIIAPVFLEGMHIASCHLGDFILSPEKRKAEPVSLPGTAQNATILSSEQLSLIVDIIVDFSILMGKKMIEEEKQARITDRMEAAKERFRIAAESVSDLIYEWNIGNDTLEWFGQIDAALGYEPGEFPRTLDAWLDSIHPDDRERLIEEVRVHRESGEPLSTEYRIIKKDGAILHWTDRGTTIFDDSGNPVKLLGVCTDITCRRLTEKALFESEAKFRMIFEESPLGICHFDSKGIITVANNSARKIIGSEKKRIIGIEIPAMLPARKILEAFRKSLAGEDGSFEGEVPNLAGGNSRILKVRFRPLFEMNGSVSGGIAILEDITKQIEAERKLEETEKRHRFLLEGQRDVVMTLSPEGAITYCSPAIKNFGDYEPEDLLGDSIEKYLVEGRTIIELLNKQLKDDNEGAKSITYELMFLPNWKDPFPIEMIAKPVSSEGRIEAFHIVSRDISERKRAEADKAVLEEQILKSQKLESLGVLAGGIAHDFNNILVAIIGNTDLAISELPQSSPVYEHLADIGAAATRAADLCRQMLAYSGKGSFFKRPVDIADTVREMSQILFASLSENTKLQYEFQEDIPAIEADATQIRQVIMNLLINASEAIGKEGGTISIRTGMKNCTTEFLNGTYFNDGLPAGRYCYLEVADNGCGMDGEVHSKIFEPFYSTKFTGRGLGLASVIGIIRGHCGAITIESKPGHGSIFTIFLPALDSMPDLPETVQPAKPGKLALSGTILLIDDDKVVLDTTERMLNRLGFQVIKASGGLEGIEKFKLHRDEIILVIVDLTMPGVDGEGTFKQLRSLDANLDIMLSSGYSQEEISRRYSGKGLTGFLQKPFTIDELKIKLSRLPSMENMDA